MKGPGRRLMENFLEALAAQAFLRNALIAGVLASIACGIVGTYVVVKRIAFLTGGIAHAVLGGMGAAYFFGEKPLAGALAAALLAALVIGWIKLRLREQEDTLIAAVWAVGMSVGILFISRTPGYNVDLMSYLFGNILMVSGMELSMMTIMCLVVILTVALFHRQFLAVTFDEEFARLRGVRVDFYYLLLLVLVAITVVLLIQVVGLILVMALLTLPAAMACQYAGSIGRIMLTAVATGIIFTVTGLAVSYQPDLPAGATIILIAGTCYLVSTVGTSLFRRRLFRKQVEADSVD